MLGIPYETDLKYGNPKKRRLCWVNMSRLMRFHCWRLPSFSRWREWRPNIILQRVEVDATPPPPIGSISVRISVDVTPDGDHVVTLDAKQVEDINEDVELFAAIGTKMNPWKWVKNSEPRVSELESSNWRSFSMMVLVRTFIWLSQFSSLLQIWLQLLELDGARLNELRMTWSLG